MIAKTQAERIDLIKQIATRRKEAIARAARMEIIKKKSAAARRAMLNARAVRTESSLEKEINKPTININQYTDAPKYAKEYYGEVLYETTRFDNDWD